MLMARMPSGKEAPLVYEPDFERGNVVLDGNGQGHTLTKAEVERMKGGPTLMDPDVDTRPRYLNHWADCGKAPRRRR
jgi:hypothetical protein